jgi:membrane fusion protein (multidrug efflux system)
MWYRSHNFVDTENAYVTGHVHPVSARIPGVVTKVLFDDNQLVKAGDVLAELDPADQGVQGRADPGPDRQRPAAGDPGRRARSSRRAQASAAKAQVVQSQANLVRAKQDAERFGQLYNTTMKAVSKAEVDAATAARAAAAADVTARRDNASAAKAQIAAAVLGARRAQGPGQGAAGAAEGRRSSSSATTASWRRSPAASVGRSVEVGARIQPGQQLAAIVQDDVWVTANFKETQLAGLKPGQPVKVEIDALPDNELVGRVDSFSPASGNQFALLPADNATGNFTKIVQRVPVKITFKPEDLKRTPAAWCRACRPWSRSTCARSRRKPRPAPPAN